MVLSTGARRAKELIMSGRRKVPMVVRTLLGLGFTVFGINFFLHFLPEPPPPASGGALLGALVASKIMTIVKIIETGAGILLLVNRFVPLALTLLAPVEIGIFMYHAAYDPSGFPVIGALMAMTIYLAWAYR